MKPISKANLVFALFSFYLITRRSSDVWLNGYKWKAFVSKQWYEIKTKKSRDDVSGNWIDDEGKFAFLRRGLRGFALWSVLTYLAAIAIDLGQ